MQAGLWTGGWGNLGVGISLPKFPTGTWWVQMELGWSLSFYFCQQMYRDLHAGSRGKQNPHHERVKKHEPVAWEAESRQSGTLCGGAGEGSMETSPFSPLFAHLSPSQEPELSANGVDPHRSINGGRRECPSV